MGKILKIEGGIVTIGMANGDMQEVRKDDVTFEPKVGDRVDIFKNENSVIVSKKEEEEPKIEKEEAPKTEGININIANNSNNDGAGAAVYTENYTTLPGQRVVNKTTYILLTIFLGGFGGHKFYTGKTLEGVLYLLFCWTYVPSLLALIELIKTAGKNKDAHGNIVV